MKYFVTGATGFVGSHVVRQLVADKHQVVVSVRTPAKAKELVEWGVKVTQGDVMDKESLRAAMQGVDGVLHIAGWYKIGVRDKSAGPAINIEGTRNVLSLMQELGIQKGVYTSTLAVNSDTHGVLVDETYQYHGKHLSEYDRSKWVAHYEVAHPLMASGLPLVVVLPGLIYGPGDTSLVHTTLVQYLQGKLMALPLRTAFSWAHVEDIARGHILAMQEGKMGESYIIAGPTHTLIEAMQFAHTITRVALPGLRMSPTVMKALAAIMDNIEKVLVVPPEYSAEYLRVNAGVTYIGNNSKAMRELGYRPRSLEEGLAETLQHEMQVLRLR